MTPDDPAQVRADLRAALIAELLEDMLIRHQCAEFRAELDTRPEWLGAIS